MGGCMDVCLSMVARQMITPVKFTYITRTIDQKTGVHYLDAIDENGVHWRAEMRTDVERRLTFSVNWKQDPQQPINYEQSTT